MTEPQDEKAGRSMTPDDFLHLILDSPDDDVPRLVFADWLDEHGDSARAEFIRVQIDLANISPRYQRRRDLEVRARELLDDHQEEWVRPLRPWVVRWAFRRGFVEEVCVPVPVYLDHAEELRRLAPIRRFEVDPTGFAVPQELLTLVPDLMATVYAALPLRLKDGKLLVAAEEGYPSGSLRDLGALLGLDGVDYVAASRDQVMDAIRRQYEPLNWWTQTT